MITSYLPEDDKHRSVLQRQLETAYAPQKIEVINLADNGEFIARYLTTGKYEKQRAGLKGLDVAIICFGINDQKRFDTAEFRQQLLDLIDLLKKDFPGVRIILQTGVYADYPAHYVTDRNQTLIPYWDAIRSVGAELGLPVCEVYQAMEQATKEGNWDLRIRQQSKDKPPRFVLDASQDHEHVGNVAWFSDIHPNPEGVRVAVKEQVKALKEIFPKELPMGNQIASRESKPNSFYIELLHCPAERLQASAKRPSVDQLQTPIEAK